MKKIFYAVAVAALSLSAISCEPQVFVMNLETRGPSTTGIDLSGKNLAVVYLENGKDSVFASSLATGFASQLERDYFDGSEAVGIYRMAKRDGDYSSRDTLLNLVLDTEADVVFLFDEPEFGEVSLSGRQKQGYVISDSSEVMQASLPYSFRLYVYDTMDKADTVRSFIGNNTARHSLYAGKDENDSQVSEKIWDALAIHGESAGVRSGTKFSPVWQEEQFLFYYQERPHKWYSAISAVDSCEWKKAADLLLELASQGKPETTACAAFDLANVFLVLGDCKLALEWLDLSDKTDKLPGSQALRKRIEAKL